MDNSEKESSTYCRALACYEAGRYRETIQLCAQLLEDAPTAEVLQLSGNALRWEGQVERAIQQLEWARQSDPKSLGILNDLAKALLEARRFHDALDLCETGLEENPYRGQFYFLMGYAQHALGDLQQAESCFLRALELRPDHAAALINLANVQYALEKFEEAANGYLRALELSPNIAEAHYNLAGAWRKLGNNREAIDRVQTALQLRPIYPQAHQRLGDLWSDLGQHADALNSYKTALRLGAENADTFYALGITHRRLGNLDVAVARLEQAVQLQPDSAEFLRSLGNTYVEQSRLDKAIACFEEALRLAPDSHQTLCSLIHQMRACGCWSGIEELTQRLCQAIDQGAVHVAPFEVLSLPTTAQQQRLAAELHVARRIGSKPGCEPPFRFTQQRDANARIKLAYLSRDFRRHPVTYLIQPVVELHNRQDFELYAFSSSPDEDSETRRRIVRAFDEFIDIRTDSHQAAANRIFEREIDILVDLSGHTQGCRPEVLALRPAPIQVLYLGYAGTTGSPYTDYAIVDTFSVPPEQQTFFTEKLVHLPGCFLPMGEARQSPNRILSRSELGLPEDGFVFCSFSNSYKISSRMFDVWMKLLRQIPDSVLWLPESNPFFPDNMRREARRRGVAPERLFFAARLPAVEDHLLRYQVVDLFLDAFPYTAHSTAIDVLRAGCPLLTIVGQTLASRVAGSVLRAAGLPDLITSNLEEYHAMARRLAEDRSLLSDLKSRLATRDLSNVEPLTCHLEDAFRLMWQRYLAGESPQSFSVSPTTE